MTAQHEDVDALTRGMAEARHALAPPEPNEETLRRWQRLERRAARPRRSLIVIGAVAAAASLIAVFPWHRLPVPVPTETARPQNELHLVDGSRVRIDGAGSQVRIDRAEPQEVALTLVAGGAQFEVSHDPNRPFTVHAGPVRVDVRGTRFAVRLLDEQTAAVAVVEGRVAVTAAGTTSELLAGDVRMFSKPVATSPAPAAPLASAAPIAPAAPIVAPRPARAIAAARAAERDAWRVLARQGRYDDAYAAMPRRPAAALDEPEALMLAADVARLSGHPSDAEPPLRRLLDRHDRDPRAPLAAFTLGRLLLEHLGDPAQAADLFERARRRAPSASVAEDALARETEARARAGQPARARACAELYLSLYPHGARAGLVRTAGGLR